MKHKDEIIRLHKEGKSYSQIQSVLGCSKGTIAYHLGSGQKDKTRERSKRNRTIQKRKLWNLKEQLGCYDCKEKYPHYMLDFDHLPEYEKIGSPTQILHKYSIEKAMLEIEKCNVVCRNCHAIRTWTRYLETIE